MIIVLFWMALALVGSTESASFECQFSIDLWGTLGAIYYCEVLNSVYIASPDVAQVDSISGQHLTGYNFENVEAFSVNRGQINYFPRGLTKFFKNLKGIQIYSTGLKEVHQSDLKDFPKLANLFLHGNHLEILEENLFEFNPNLDYIYLVSNKITHIDPKVFVNLIKLKTLYLISNACINMYADNNPAQLQNVIRTAQIQCTNLDYLNLEQQVKYLEMESKLLDSENLKQKLENLENQIKISKFSNFFRESLKGLNVAVIMREAILKINDKLVVQDSKISGMEQMLKHIINAIEDLNGKFAD